MTTNFVDSLEAEITQLENELRGDSRYRKLLRLRAALAEYEPAANTAQVRPRPLVGISTMAGSRAFHKKGDKIKAAAIAFLQQCDRAHRTEILEHLECSGLLGQEKDPMASLAAYFSGWRDTFESDGAGYWSLKKSVQAAE
jgi:hypothetical protein